MEKTDELREVVKYYFLCRAMSHFGKCMEVIVKLGKTNTMTNAWGKTKTKTDKDKKVKSKRILVEYNN